jgi:hypothetical protein
MFCSFWRGIAPPFSEKAATICHRFTSDLFSGEIKAITEMKSVSRRGFSVVGRYNVLKDKIRFEPPSDAEI